LFEKKWVLGEPIWDGNTLIWVIMLFSIQVLGEPIWDGNAL